jgi:hypothetical protein
MTTARQTLETVLGVTVPTTQAATIAQAQSVYQGALTKALDALQGGGTHATYEAAIVAAQKTFSAAVDAAKQQAQASKTAAQNTFAGNGTGDTFNS